MARRRQAREAALKLLYQHDLVPETSEETAKQVLAELIDDEAMQEFAWTLFDGARAAIAELDEQIAQVAANWDIKRMATTDRNIIRMGIFEMLTLKTAPAIVINECVDIAKEFGSEQSGSFVNGILDQIKLSDRTA